MKLSLGAMMFCGLLTASCTQSLEQIVEERHQQRINAANANSTLGRGAADGLGSYIAQSRTEEMHGGEQPAIP